MSALRLLVVEPDASDPPGRLGEWLEGAGATLDVRNPAVEQLPETTEGYAGIVCLGGGMGVHDVSTYPWLLPLQKLLAQATADQVPTLAICLGAQLLAAANGGSVGVAERPEAGGDLVSKRDAAWQDPLVAEVPLLPDVVQFHADSIEQLPVGAELLAGGMVCANQAFRVGQYAYGLQFHIETSPETVRQWVSHAPDIAAWGKAGAFDDDTLAQLHRDVEEVWRPVVDNFARLAKGEIEPVARRRSLPLNER